MNILSSFNNFYSNLSSDGIFFFWIIIFLFCFLIFLSIVLIVKNRKLTKLLEDTQLDDDPTIYESEIKEDTKNQVVEEVITEKEEPIVKQEIDTSKEELKIEDSKEETGPYKKNVLREMNTRMQTSPINIVREEDNYGFDESYLREESVSPLEEMEDLYQENDNMKFASEIVERMEEEIKPSNIELTEYERKQEEEAIISYDELLKVKDKIYNITEDEETDEFIDELRSFRLDL